ncbi:MAG TPA: dTDP-4-dehydrorhamnose 3,5-epimerase [Actinomycetes bacterium]|nr:dTDP-4-dehydrorhamnose 3,5-epimerase [Actinomycetes bacterium]
MGHRELMVPDAYELAPTSHADDRGVFLEWFTRSRFEQETGHRLPLAQANCSVSRRGVVRGIHFADVPPGQGKYLTCPAGAVLDVVVDLREGSPTFGRWDAVRLDDEKRNAVYVAEGLGHAFQALSDSATLVYLCSEAYAPAREHAVHPLDPDLAIDWPSPDGVVLSPKDEAAPSLREMQSGGRLPSWAACQELYTRRR